MANGYSGFVDNTGGTLAHEKMLDVFETCLQANGWTTKRKLNTGGAGDARTYELIMQGVGLSGTEQIFIGFQCYQSSTADYYNISYSAFTGYVAANTFDTQPGVNVKGVCAHNQRIDYWLRATAQGIAFILKVGTPIYEWGGVGKFFPDTPPSQYSYPVWCGGSLTGRPATRYSDTTRFVPMRSAGNTNLVMRDNAGTWQQPQTSVNGTVSSATNVRDTNGKYHLVPVQLCDLAGDTNPPSSNIWGWLDGIYFVTGFNNVTENTMTVNGRNYIIAQDIGRTAFNSYFALDVTP